MTDRFAIASIQANPTLGAIEHNEAIARDRIREAKVLGADLVVFPEMFILGYPPEDLVLKPAVLSACQVALKRLAEETREGPSVLMGAPWAGSARPRNAVALLQDGGIKDVTFKVDLPNYGVFDERRVFEAGASPKVFEVKGVRIGVPVCEDIWSAAVCGALKAMGAEILVTPNGSPYRYTADQERCTIARARVAETGLPLVYVNQVGGQDELVFDGGSFALDADGSMPQRLAMFEEAVDVSCWAREGEGWACKDASVGEWPSHYEEMYRAMVLGLRDYIGKSGFPGVVLGMSGGVNSAISAVIAADALGPDKVRCVMMPSAYTSQESLDDARECSENLGVSYETVPIVPAVEAFTGMFAPLFQGRGADTTEENLQSRIRGLILMAISNKFGPMVLTTGNKSEMAVGYATLYGDMCGGYNCLKDVYKTDVYKLCAWRNENDPYGVAKAPIPERIITKAPSAELKPDQKDQDSLPPYDVLDAILHGLVEEEATLDEIVARGLPAADVERVQRLLYNSEYKRRQAPPGVKIGPKAFGRDRRYPLVNGFRDRITSRD